MMVLVNWRLSISSTHYKALISGVSINAWVGSLDLLEGTSLGD